MNACAYTLMNTCIVTVVAKLKVGPVPYKVLGLFSNRTGTSDDDVGARGIVWILS